MDPCGKRVRKKREKRIVIAVTLSLIIGFIIGVAFSVVFQNYEIVISQNDKRSTEKHINRDNDVNAPPGTKNQEVITMTEKSKKIVAIDAGHQQKGNFEKEPVGPGSSQMKAKVSGGTVGVATKKPEYQVTLDVAILLEQELLKRGYEVVMIRRTNDVDISNSQRAIVAKNAQADAFIRIHCNGIENGAVKGALTMCQTKNNKYCGDLYKESRTLSECVIDSLCEQTGAKNLGVAENDDMSGINWSSVPVTIVEMGFMTNPEEDKLLCDPIYQRNLAIGIANGIDDFFEL